ncbi:hypothetical protein ACI2K4_11965 [Micromonospora sp. NPDC050397]|uniref:LppU/SCO3897 family protein n=1 Tax=Micromonospora sp. NPDC050397 TaxID=3364279 RepID=UPI00384E32D5
MTDQAPPPPVTPASQEPVPPVPPPVDPAAPAPAAAPVPVSPPAKKSPVKKIVGVLAVIVVAVVVKVAVGTVLGGVFGGEDKTAEAKVGDCLAALPEVAEGEEKEAPNAKVVECTSTEAAYSVVGRIDDQTEAQAAASTECAQYAAEGEEYATFYTIPPGGSGYVLCLKPTKP